MSGCDHNCENCSANCAERKIAPEITFSNSNIKNVIGIVSGKGGVGKSLVTALLASSMNNKNYKTAILDADITGPSIPKIFGIHGHVFSDGHFIQPAVSKKGIKIISMNLCLSGEGEPVVWRGPVISGVVKQFWEEVDWEDIDYMFVDMPPGTGDVPLTAFQSIPLKGIIIVTTPQELVSMIVSKALRMAEMMNIPVLGIVENMSYFECPDCGKRHYIFGKSNIEKINENSSELPEFFKIKNFAQIPINPELAELCDKGEIENFNIQKAEGFLKNIIEAI